MSVLRQARHSALWLALGALGCTSSRSNDSGEIVTAVRVEPRIFMGSVPCELGDEAGLKRYVATLSDVTPTQPEFTLASSPPTPCDRGVNFTYVAPGHYYTVEILGYDRTDIAAVSPGSDILVAEADPSQLIAPKWRARCGEELVENPPGSGTYTTASALEGQDAGLPDSLGPAIRARSSRLIPFTSCEVLEPLD